MMNYAQMATGMGNGAGFVYGALKAANDDAINPGKFRQVGFTAASDPVLNALSYDAMLQLGLGDASLFAGQSPIDKVRAAALQSGSFTRDDLDRLNNALMSLRANGSLSGATDSKVRAVFEKAVRLAGYNNPDDVLRSQTEFNTNLARLQGEMTPANEATRAARYAALQRMAQTVQDYPGATNADITALEQQMYRQAQTDLDWQAKNAQDEILRAANMGGFNPGRALGQMRGAAGVEAARARTTAIDRAIAMLSGRQGLANTAIAGMQGYLQQPTQNLQAASQIRTGAQISAAQLAAAQLDAMNQAAVTNAISNRQTRDAYVTSAANSFMDAAGGMGGGSMSMGSSGNTGPGTT